MRSLRFACLLICGACSTTPGITLSATPNPLPGDGQTPATVVATVTRGGSPEDGATVHFTSTLGTFDGAASGTPNLIDVQTADGGKAVAKLIPPRQGWGTVQLNASVSIDGAQPAIATTLPLAPAGGLAATLSFTCKQQNIGAFVHNRMDTIHNLCIATAYDATNHPIPKASVQTLAEAGVLDWSRDDNGLQEFVYSVAADAPPPKDTSPLDANGHETDVCPPGCQAAPFDRTQCPGEPCWLDPTGITHNPRDGVATLIAAVPGIKSYDDQGEPFVDANDNGVRDPGEPYIDFNGNGKYDGPSGKLQDRLIWKAVRIVWSGEADRTGTPHSSFIQTTAQKTSTGATGSATITFFDQNFNALAAANLAGGDAIDLSSGICTGDGSITLAHDALAMIQRDPGILFKASDGSIDITPSNVRSSFTRSVQYGVGAVLTGTAGQSCGFSATPNRVYDPGTPGTPGTSSLNTETIAGGFGF